MKKYAEKKTKKKIYYFFRSAQITALAAVIIIMLCYGFSEIYVQQRRIYFNEYVSAVEILPNGIRILDFVITF